MNSIKIHLREEEHAAVQRYAEALGVSPEDIAYSALNRLMLHLKAEEAPISRDIVETRDWRPRNLPLWSDSARAVHLYEGKADAYSTPSDWRK